MALHPLRVVHKTDPKQDILDGVKHLTPCFKPIGALVFLIMYERGRQKDGEMARTEGGIWVPETATGVLAEDKWQGKVGLVIAMGPLAFTEDESHRWGDVKPQVGDWVMISIGDTYSFDLPGQYRARAVEDVNVKFIVAPEAMDAVW